MKKKHKYELCVYEQLYRSPKTIEESEGNRNPRRIDVDHMKIVGMNVDDCLKKAREHVEKKMGRVIRSCSIGPQGIYVVVYNAQERNPIDSYSEKTGKRK